MSYVLQRAATRCNALQHAATRCIIARQRREQHSEQLRAAAHCDTLQHAATRCNALQISKAEAGADHV